MPTDFATDFLADAFAEFARRYPAISFHLDMAAPEHAEHVFLLRGAVLMRNIAHMQDDISILDLFQRGAESRHEMRGKIGDEPDRIGKYRLLLVGQFDFSHRWV